MALSLLRGFSHLQYIAAPALSRVLPQLLRLGPQDQEWHAALPARTALHTTPIWQQSPGDDPQRIALVNRLLYRSRQRGFLELDLLVGLWAEREVPKMSVEQMEDLAVLLDQENPDLFKWLTGQHEPSEQMQHNSAFRALREHTKRMMDENRHEAAAAVPGKTWVRGWDDWKKEGPEPGPAVAAGASS